VEKLVRGCPSCSLLSSSPLYFTLVDMYLPISMYTSDPLQHHSNAPATIDIFYQ
jgi:hypothetical protein